MNSTITLPESISNLEEIRALRTHIVARHVNLGHRVLAVCASSEGVGCTFTAYSLAVSLSQIGLNTLLVDADLRNPSITRIFDAPKRSPDLLSALATDVGFNDCVSRDVIPFLSILGTDQPVPNAQELISGERFEQLVGFCVREFDAMIIDTPPANRYSDARRVGGIARYALVVARRNKTYVNDLKLLSKQLAGDGAEVIGCVMTEA